MPEGLRGAAWVSQEVPTQLSPATGPERAEAPLPAPAFCGLQPCGGGASVPGGRAEVGAGPGWGLESESQDARTRGEATAPQQRLYTSTSSEEFV